MKEIVLTCDRCGATNRNPFTPYGFEPEASWEEDGWADVYPIAVTPVGYASGLAEPTTVCPGCLLEHELTQLEQRLEQIRTRQERDR